MSTLTAAERQAQRIREMEEAAARITPGEEWIFRAQDDGPSRRVRVVGQRRTAKTVQVEVEFLEGPRAGQRQSVGLGRLKGAWSEVEAFDAHDRKRRDIAHSHDSYRPEYSAAMEALVHLVPAEVAGRTPWPTRGVIVRDRDALAAICAVPHAEIVTEKDSLEVDEGLLVGADTVIRLAKAACQAHPERMEAELLRRERRLLTSARSRDSYVLAPEQHTTAVLHEWCGTQPLEVRLLVMALENEVSWQRALVGAAADTLRRCGVKSVADNLERHSKDGPDEADHDSDEPDDNEGNLGAGYDPYPNSFREATSWA